jgi:FkbM family methyltransferase
MARNARKKTLGAWAARGRDATKVALTRYPQVYDGLRRPYAVARYWLRQPHDTDYGVFGLFPDRDGVFLDVGANSGMSALSFRIYNRANPVISIEPNPFHENDLRFVGRLIKRFSYRLWAAGQEPGELTLYVPVFKGVPLTTEASLVREAVTGSKSLRARLGARMESDDFEVVSRTVPVRALDSLAVQAAFVKLDVQGFEHQALLGLANTLSRDRPVLLIETPDVDVRRYVAGLGYEPFVYAPSERRLVPETTKGRNTVFVAR